MDITGKLWSFCHILRQDGVDNADYIEQLTYLLFLKMADENEIKVPLSCQWKTLTTKEGEDLKTHYDLILQTLKAEPGILGQIFQEPISKIKNSASLKKIIEGIESIGWTHLEKDVQGEAFEGLLEKIANEGKKGAGQFFTPRPLIEAIVNVMKPNPLEKKGFKISDVACGTAGFLTTAVQWAKNNLPGNKWEKVKNNCYFGQELVVRPFRLALMNLFLHDVTPSLTLGDSIYTDRHINESFDCILTNPPFGTRGVAGPPKARKFFLETSNIQINFIQHINEILKPQGRAAIVLPDSCLSDSKSRELWSNYIGNGFWNVHTILKLPRGTFNPYANGVKACVIFIQKGRPTKDVWVYDARTGVEDVTKISRPLKYEKHFGDFVQCYGEDCNGSSPRNISEKFEKFSLSEIEKRNYDLSFGKLYQPEAVEKPLFYIDKLIDNFQVQLDNLQQLRGILESKH